jgi:hypothetical protein
MTLILSAIVFGGTAFAADKKAPCQTDCSCTVGKGQTPEGKAFKSLFPEHEIQPRIEG